MRLLTVNQVMELTGLSPVTIWRYEKAGIFPNRRQLGPRRVGWLESEVIQWQESRPLVSQERGMSA